VFINRAHLTDEDSLREAYWRVRKDARPDANLADLHRRLQLGIAFHENLLVRPVRLIGG